MDLLLRVPVCYCYLSRGYQEGGVKPGFVGLLFYEDFFRPKV